VLHIFKNTYVIYLVAGFDKEIIQAKIFLNRLKYII
jgi:hypothetical protein